ncbi:RagB/SusD family nutrient uptake outer membrane protein [Agriterribacter sp.]|uniref:RagB/SusD family nutrient uptake outer membrane protein n=1 Tax=Agriterribacter sp. TaxID=2821509 RepID=UPI002B702C3E|nr:RagB/SusD family nutrient uptake outer membrane protein [Agriterribacter sp.]HTN05339.1 RagB/SusD family nutrient uptake outer membrane protein [Agriterribacter sp.]
MKAKMNIFFLTLSCTLVSCNKLLEVKPETFTSGSNYYKTENQVRTAVNGAYSVLQNLNNNGNYWIFTEVRSDNTTYQYNPNNRCCITREQVDEFLNTSTDRYTETVWTTLFNGIQQCNVILSRIEGATFTDDAKKNQYIGEAKFLRGLLYFNLVRLFGGVPLRVEEVRGPGDAFTEERASVEAVYAQIIQDAKDAAEKLPASYPGESVGRATKGAALTLLGDVYLTRKDYPNAIKFLQEVTGLGYQLVPEYADVFSPLNKNNSESVFEVQYDAGIQGENSNFFFNFGPFTAGLDLTGFQGQLGGLNIPTPSIINAYEPGDKRKDASIGYYANPDNNNAFESFPGGNIPFIKKFYHPPFPNNGWTNEDWPVYRYAHVLLMLAEALNEDNKTGDAYAPLNRVRQRAGLAPLSGLSKEGFREAVYQEERVELAFENQRWFDLLRTGRAIEVMLAHGAEEKVRLARVGSESYNVQEYMLVFPIPASEVRLNGFEQNPNY